MITYRILFVNTFFKTFLLFSINFIFPHHIFSKHIFLSHNCISNYMRITMFKQIPRRIPWWILPNVLPLGGLSASSDDNIERTNVPEFAKIIKNVHNNTSATMESTIPSRLSLKSLNFKPVRNPLYIRICFLENLFLPIMILWNYTMKTFPNNFRKMDSGSILCFRNENFISVIIPC